MHGARKGNYLDPKLFFYIFFSFCCKSMSTTTCLLCPTRKNNVTEQWSTRSVIPFCYETTILLVFGLLDPFLSLGRARSNSNEGCTFFHVVE
ncbi:hypothetical protein BKA57DRAFT_462538 [Linnemannia elongata]|nr:hypothetical protein BKA57DRAFT_462538 [Linnemannia elongata]